LSRIIWISTRDLRIRVALFLLVCWLSLFLDGCQGCGKHDQTMGLTQMLDAVTDNKIEFVTTSIDRATLPTLGRRVVVTGPPEVVKLLSIGDVRVLEELVGLLRDPHRAWAAEVVLASLTHNEEDIVNAFAAHPDQWQDSAGKNAYGRWNEWLQSSRGKLVWDPEAHVFVEK